MKENIHSHKGLAMGMSAGGATFTWCFKAFSAICHQNLYADTNVSMQAYQTVLPGGVRNWVGLVHINHII